MEIGQIACGITNSRLFFHIYLLSPLGPRFSLALIGLKDLPDLKFSSFNPPLVKAGSINKLVEWLTNEKFAGLNFPPSGSLWS